MSVSVKKRHDSKERAGHLFVAVDTKIAQTTRPTAAYKTQLSAME